MRGSSVLRVIRKKFFRSASLSVCLLCGCFLFGGFVAMVYSEASHFSLQAELREYLFDYCVMYDDGHIAIEFRDCVRLYFGYIIPAFLFGFSSLGVLLIPALTAGAGFSFFYTVLCFGNSFGKQGILIAASLIFVRLVFTLPCFLVISNLAWGFSCRLAAMYFGRGKRVERVRYPGWYVVLFVSCLLLLCAGVFCERVITPRLFRAVVDHYLMEGGAS